MPDDINRFWIPVAQILPVFILALGVEARAAFSQRLKELDKSPRKGDREQSRFARAMDGSADISYAVVFVLAMVLLVLSFLVALGVLAFESPVNESHVSAVYFTILVGVCFTGLLPVLRLISRVVAGNAAKIAAPTASRREGKEK